MFLENKMSKIPILVLFTIIFVSTKFTTASVGGYIGDSDTKKFVEIFKKALSNAQDDILTPYYAVKANNLLGTVIDANLVKSTCDNLKLRYKADANPEATFNALGAWSLLKCSGKLHNEETVKNLKDVSENPKSTVAEIRYAAEALSLISQSVSNSAKILQNLQSRLKEDDSLQSLGHAFHTVAVLGNGGSFVHDRVEEIVVQADEVDGKLLQWEGGLTTTSLILTGLLRDSRVKNPFNQQQAEKLANYLLSRRTVQTPKGVLALLEAALALSNSKTSPVSITVVGPSHVTTEKPNLIVKVGDLFGKPSKTSATPVVAQSATRISDDVVVLSKQALSPGTKPAEFVLPLKLEPGHYRISLLAGSNTASLDVRVLGLVTLQSFEIGLTDADGSSTPKLTKLQMPSKLPAPLEGDSSQQLYLKFVLSRSVHQAFLRLKSEKREIVFVAEQDSSKAYKIDVNLANELTYSDKFELELIIGDAVISNPILWNIGNLNVNLNGPVPKQKPVKGPKPEIKHLFRPAEKRPAEAVSYFFTILTLSPILLLLILWARIGINFGNFSIISLPFHLGFGSILGLFTLFWLKLNMFTTCAWLIPIGGFTFFSGHKLLSKIARNKKPEKAEK